MKFILVVSCALFLLSCSSKGNREPSNTQSDSGTPADDKEAILNQTFNVDSAGILKDYTTWYNYVYYNVPLSEDFIGLNTDSTVINKTTFLNILMQENTVPFKIKQLQGQPVYKLYTLNNKKKDIANTAAYLAEMEMKHYKMEGKEIPSFNFTDVNGIKYDNTSTGGKIIVLKCWFIACVACVKEFPECNKLVDEYAGRNDIVFISLALNKKKELLQFLKTKSLKYAVIPEAETYIKDSLNISIYPTHLLIDKSGKLVKVVNSLEELEPFLKREVKM